MKKIVRKFKKAFLVGVLSFSVIGSSTTYAEIVNSNDYVGYYLFNDINIYNHYNNDKGENIIKVLKDQDINGFTQNVKYFTETFIPSEIGDVDIFISNIIYSNNNSYYESAKKNRSSSIVVGGNDFKEFIEVFAEHVAYKSLESFDSLEWDDYEKITGGKKELSNTNLEQNSLFNSFTEDFTLYIDYSFNLKSLLELRNQKHNNYGFTMDTIEYFDLIFPEIKEYRLNKEYLSNMYLSKTSNWSKESVVSFFSNGFELSGDNFQKEMLTRQDFAIMLSDVIEKLGYHVESSESFNDTSNLKVRKTATLGLINGTGYNMFTPNKPITRGEMIVILERFKAISGIEIQIDKNEPDKQVSKEIGIVIIERLCKEANLLPVY